MNTWNETKHWKNKKHMDKILHPLYTNLKIKYIRMAKSGDLKVVDNSSSCNTKAAD